MPDVNLSLAISYYDHVSDLVRERVRPDGIALTINELPVEEIFYRMISHAEWDVSELSMAKYVALVGEGAPPFRAIPVFPSRVFRHSAFYVATRAGIGTVQDLAGRSIGVPEWAQTAGIYARALLQHQYDVPLSSIRWVQGGVNEPGRREKVSLSLPSGVAIERVTDRSLTDMLLEGDLDGIISAREPTAFMTGDPRIARLWPDTRALEERYYLDTHIFPIMHVIVIKSDTLERHPWIAMNLFKAFDLAKNNSLRRFAGRTTSRIPAPWPHDAFDQARQVFGPDHWPYGVGPNRPTLEAFLRFCQEQGVSNRLVSLAELFPPEVASVFKV